VLKRNRSGGRVEEPFKVGRGDGRKGRRTKKTPTWGVGGASGKRPWVLASREGGVGVGEGRSQSVIMLPTHVSKLLGALSQRFCVRSHTSVCRRYRADLNPQRNLTTDSGIRQT
jgi:hypothetical protein